MRTSASLSLRPLTGRRSVARRVPPGLSGPPSGLGSCERPQAPIAHPVTPGGWSRASDLVLREHAFFGKHSVVVDALHMPVSCDVWSVFAAPECLA